MGRRANEGALLGGSPWDSAMNSYGEAFSAFYDDQFGNYSEKAAPILLRFFSNLILSKTIPEILDLGCGTGRIAFHFLEAGYSFTGLDLSSDMLDLARARCSHLLAGRNATFLQQDISGFYLTDSFGLVLSTYNAVNHLEGARNLQECFQSVRPCLVKGGWFIFDYHTIKGLEQWSVSETSHFDKGELKTSGIFYAEKGLALLNLKGSYGGSSIDETFQNFSIPLIELNDLLKSGGFNRIVYSKMDDLGAVVEEPVCENRIVVMAS